MAMSSPLLETNINGARGIVVNITASPDISLDEIDQAATIITDEAHPDATVIFGAAMDPSLEDEMRITLIAAGFEKSGQRKPNPAYSAPSYSNPEPSPAQESATEQNRREFDEIFDLLNRK